MRSSSSHQGHQVWDCCLSLSLSLTPSAASSYELVQIADIYYDEFSYFIQESQLELVGTCSNYYLLI